MQPGNLRTLAATILVLALAPAFAFSQQAPPAQPDVTKPVAETVPANAPKEAGEAVDIHTYLIGPEDVLMINVWREKDFSGPQVVRPDGNITIPLIGEIHAGGQTPAQLSDKLHEALSKLINNPDVSVSVNAVNSKQYFIDGQVRRPGEYKLVTPTTILEALSKAGGFLDFANPKKIRILRGNESLKFNWKDVSRGKNMEQNVLLQSGDHIIVP